MKIRFASSLAALLLMPVLVQASTFAVHGGDTKAWAAILGSVGMTAAVNDQAADVIVAGSSAPSGLAQLAEKRIVIVEGTGDSAAQFGISIAGSETVSVRQIVDTHAPAMQIIWQSAVEVRRASLPPGFTVLAEEKWKHAPVLAGKTTAHGAVLWMAAGPGASGIERFPYLLQALTDLGWTASAQTAGLWAFFDSSYRLRADPEYLARRWRQAGIAVLHVAAWHNMDPDQTRDAYLEQLVAACHRHAISVYAWLELPHVSEQFWAEHPEWREKTAVGQDAQLDWRKLMNLQNPDCRRAVEASIRQLLARFDWDGVNVAELYFESLEGANNPARFTPMNDDVRQEFQRAQGFDPKQLFEPNSPYAAATHPEALRKFLDYRAGLAARMQGEWLHSIAQSKAAKPYLDIVLTHIDDRFEPGIRDELGADVARSLPLIRANRSTLLVEDPATLWALGPERYGRLADKYKEIAAPGDRLAVDINVVERYQDVYPTKKQTGVELFQLLHQASASFGRVALYFENSLEKQDLGLLPAAATTAQVTAHGPDELDVKAAEPTRVVWRGAVDLDGKPWPVQSRDFVLAPGGTHRLSPGITKPDLIVTDFNGDIQTAQAGTGRVDCSYRSRTRAIAVLSSTVSSVQVDGELYSKGSTDTVLLPAGQHIVTFIR